MEKKHATSHARNGVHEHSNKHAEANLSHQSQTVKYLFILFAVLAVAFILLKPGRLIYFILVACACGWFFLQRKRHPVRSETRSAIYVGLFLMVFDFIVENAGGFLGLWKTYGSILPIYFVPVEIMMLCLVGGTAWALYLPKKFNWNYSILDIVFFSLFGAIGEAVLMHNSLIAYTGGWTSVHAFFGYLVTWIILNFMRYRVFKV